MKSFFISKFEYGHKMNSVLLDILLKNPEQKDAIKLLSHIMHAQHIWLGRLKNPDFQSPPLWDTIPADELTAKVENDFKEWKSYLEKLSDKDLESTVTYKNTKGEGFANILHDVLFHVVNHATHHRAQISQLLRMGGITPPITDYIFYIREK